MRLNSSDKRIIKIVRDPTLIQVTDSDNENSAKHPKLRVLRWQPQSIQPHMGALLSHMPMKPALPEASVHFADTQKRGSTRTGFLRFNQTPEAFGEMPGEEPQHK